MKTKLFKLLPLILAALMLISCRPSEPHEEEPPRVTETPEASYTVSHMIRYWPEEASYDTCDYACTVQLPVFSKEHASGYAMNAAVDAYLESLAARIETQYMRDASQKPPYTEVTFEHSSANGVTNVLFREKHSWDTEPYSETHVLMLNERGARIGINDVFLNYHADERAAEIISKRLEDDPRFPAKSKEELMPFIDAREGVCAIENGARIYVRRGGIAPLQEGELAFDIEFSELLPEIFGECELDMEQYRGLVMLLRDVSDSAVVRMENIENGSASPYTATAFMARAVRRLGILPKAGRTAVPQKEFEALYAACIGGSFPGTDTQAHDIKLENGEYSVSDSVPAFEYNVDILSVKREGDTIEIEGDMISGSFGAPDTMFNSHVTVTVEINPESPYGFRVANYMIHM